MGSKLKKVLGKCKSFPKTLRIAISAEKIKRKKEKIIKKKDYVEAVHMLRSLGDYERDEFLLQLLYAHSDAALFVLAFADSNMESYSQAYSLEMGEYDWDDEAIKKAIEQNLDESLCGYMRQYDSYDDLDYVLELTERTPWLESYKRAERGLLWTKGIYWTGEYFLPVLFLKKQT